MATEKVSTAARGAKIEAVDFLRFIRASISEREMEFETVNARREQLRVEISELRAEETFWAAETGETKAPFQGRPLKPAVPDRSQHTVMPPGMKVVYADVARRVLEEEGGPLRTEQIARLLARGGYIPAGHEGRTGAIYSSMARRRTEFFRTKEGCWGLVGRDDD
jgi:hypothetical protein